MLLMGCDNSGSNKPEDFIYIVEAGGGETFKIKINDPVVAAKADSLLNAGVKNIVHGYLDAGDGGFNAPYSWHMDPDSVSFPDLAIELCDGRPSFVEEDLDYWLNTVGIFCPWGAEIVGRE